MNSISIDSESHSLKSNISSVVDLNSTPDYFYSSLYSLIPESPKYLQIYQSTLAGMKIYRTPINSHPQCLLIS